MAKVKVEVTGAVVDGKGTGEQLSLEQKTAEKLETQGYVKVLKQNKSTQKKDEA